MSAIRISCRVKFANTNDAPGLDVLVLETGNGTYNVGQTGPDGRIDAFVRERRMLDLFFFEIEDPFDNPELVVEISDAKGHKFQSPPFSVIVLPREFNPNETATDPAPAIGSQAEAADNAIQGVIGTNAPGWVLLIRKDGVEWINVTRGAARIEAADTFARAMTNDTIVHIASMSKPITATALVAMLEDWGAIGDAVGAIGTGGAPTQTLRIEVPPQWRWRWFPEPFFWEWLWEWLPGAVSFVDVPVVLAPLFSDRNRAAEFLSSGLPANTSPDVINALRAFAQDNARVSPPPVSPPGHFGLLRRVINGESVPAYTDAFLPLIRNRLGSAFTSGTGIDNIRLVDLLLHETDLNHGLTQGLHTAAEMATQTTTEPSGALATNDYWGFVAALLSEPGNRQAAAWPGQFYSNNNFTVLTTVIEACTDAKFDDFVVRRLFFDPRFSGIRRRVVDEDAGAYYYTGNGPNWTGGLPLADYSSWPGNGVVFM
jgi:hypothetical protein